MSCDTKGDIFEENVHGDKRLYRRLNDITELGDFVLKSIHCNDRELEVRVRNYTVYTFLILDCRNESSHLR